MRGPRKVPDTWRPHAKGSFFITSYKTLPYAFRKILTKPKNQKTYAASQYVSAFQIILNNKT
jgi:hypothetical protein